jgi:tetratricopeptide (TPR) repeat protein
MKILRLRTLLFLVLAAVIAGCGSEDPALDVPMPSLEGAEALVAERVREAAEEIVRDSDSSAAWGRLGVVYDLNGFAAEALPCYEQASKLDPDEWRWPYFAGIALLDADPPAAAEHLARAAEIAPDYAPLEFRRGMVALRARDLDTAQRHFERTMELDPAFVNALLGQAHVAVAREDPAAALRIIERAVALAPDESAVHFHRGEAYRMLDQPERAALADRLGDSSANPPGDDGFATFVDPARDEVTLAEGVTVEWLSRNAARHLAAGRNAQAMEALRQAIEEDPDSVDLRLEISRALAQLGSFDQAGIEAEHALRLDGDRAESYVQMGDVLGRVGRTEQAERAFRRALEIDPDLPQAKGALGLLLTETGNLDEAIDLLRGASAAFPGDMDLQYNLAAAYVRRGSLDEAAAVASDLAKQRPDYAPAYALQGTIHAMAGRLDESVVALRKAIELAPDDADARTDLGQSLWELGRYAESIDAYTQAATRRPNDLEVSRELAWALATCPEDGLRDGDRALILAQRLCEQSQFQNPMHLETLAAAQAETGSFDAAAETAGQALSIVETTLSDLDPADAGTRNVLRDFARQLRARQARYRSGSS